MEAVNIYPELVTHRINKQGYAPIVIRFDFKRTHICTHNLGQKVKPEFWDFETKRVKSKCPNSALLNSLLENSLNRHKNFILKRQTFGLPLTKEIIKQYLLSNSAYENFYEYAEKVINEKKLKDGKPYTEDSKRRYRDEIKRMMQFKAELHFNQVGVTFLIDYKQWLQNVYVKKDKTKLEHNSIWKALGFIRMVYNEAIRNEIILPDGNPFKQFKVGTYKENLTKIKYLELSEVEIIEQELLTNANISELTKKIGWRFLSMCVSGMRISDAMMLDDCFFNDAGDLLFTPHKTRRHQNTAQIPIITERQRRYFETTLANKLPATDAKSFRTTFNIHLKILAAAAGLSINLTSHVGRHTMGGFIVDAGIEIKPAMAMFGVRSKKTIETYLHLKNDKLRIEADKLGNVM
jgi:integrase